MQDIDDDRREVTRLVARLLDLIGSTGREEACALAPLRWELTRRLFPLLTLEQFVGVRSREGASDLLVRWKAHSRAWTTCRITTHWDEYVVDTRVLLNEVSVFYKAV